MANGHGGARAGSGPKKKPLAEKITDGNPSKRPLEAIAFPVTPLTGEEMPQPKEFLAAQQSGGGTTKAVEIYESTWQWLHERSCDHLIPPQVLETYAQTAARWIQCEEAISAYGFLGKHPTTGAPIQSPFVAIGQSFILGQFSGSWHDLTDRPTAISSWLNDMGFQTAAQVEAAIDAALSQLGEVFIVVDTLPAVGLPGKIYLVSEGGNFAQFIWHNGAFKRKGSADVSLEGYFHEGNLVPITNQEIDAMLAVTGERMKKVLDYDGFSHSDRPLVSVYAVA